MATNNNNILSDYVKRYAFIDSVTVTGDFTKVRVSGSSMVKDCNFNFESDTVTARTLDGMFDGCVNAVFSHELRIYGDTISSAQCTFRDCQSAQLPVVDITDSGIVDCESMFENCYSAVLCGVGIPRSAGRFSKMFRNAKSAFFNEISEIPVGNGDYTELFSGCENGDFQKLHFSESGDKNYICKSMFYYCGNMDCGDIGLENISRNIADSSYMFYSAGRSGSPMMDGNVFSFSSLHNCEHMFTNSKFSFKDSFFRFDGNGEFYDGMACTINVTSISMMFSGCDYCDSRSPVVVLGHAAYGSMDMDSMDSVLDGRLYGHYGTSIANAITDFSHLYENSSFKTLDIRGISNNGVLMSNGFGGVRNFAFMCKGCSNMTEIMGYVPTNADTYESMFEGCLSLSADISKIFRNQNVPWENMEDLPTAFNENEQMMSYAMTNAKRMFKDCGYLYSSSDIVDLVGFFKRIKSNVGNDSKTAVESVRDMFPPMRIAPKNPIPEFRNMEYDLANISRRTHTVRYNSFVDEPFETEDGNLSDISEFGLYSEYAKSAFSSGYYRYGGRFYGKDSDKCFFVMYRPDIDESDGHVVGFSKSDMQWTSGMIPHGWETLFNTDKSKGYWSEFRFDSVYAGMVCDLQGNLLKYAYVGNYTRIYHEIVTNANGSYEVVTNYEMPVTYFDGYEDTIVPL